MRPDCKYTQSHEWLKIDGNIALIGITDFAVKELTDLVFVELPVPGTKVSKEDSMGEIESVKTVAELYAPLSGEIVEVNEALSENLDWFSSSPFEKAWMVKIKFSDKGELDSLMSLEDYEKTL